MSVQYYPRGNAEMNQRPRLIYSENGIAIRRSDGTYFVLSGDGKCSIIQNMFAAFDAVR